jgi:hypothetical protein
MKTLLPKSALLSGFALAFRTKLTLVCLIAGVVSASVAASASPVIRALSGAEQQTTYQAAFPAPLIVWVSDPATERSLAGVAVTFTAEPGIRLSSTTAMTDERGMAQVTAIGLTPCTSRVTARAAGVHETAEFGELVVNKAVLTVVPEDMESNPGVVPEISSYTIRGFVNGENEDSAHVSGVPSLSTTASTSSHYGNYAIKGGVGTLTAPNYTFVAGFGTLAMEADPRAKNPLDRPRQASKDVIMPVDRSIEVHPAILQQMMTVLIAPASVVEGFGKDLALPVRAAMRANTAVVEGYQSDARLPVREAIEHQGLGAGLVSSGAIGLRSAEPVAPVIMPSPEAQSATKQNAPVHAAISAGAVQTVTQSPSAMNGSTIRKALVLPGTN